MTSVFRFVRKRKKFFKCVILVLMCCVGERDKRLTATRKIPQIIHAKNHDREDNREIVAFRIID